MPGSSFKSTCCHYSCSTTWTRNFRSWPCSCLSNWQSWAVRTKKSAKRRKKIKMKSTWNRSEWKERFSYTKSHLKKPCWAQKWSRPWCFTWKTVFRRRRKFRNIIKWSNLWSCFSSRSWRCLRATTYKRNYWSKWRRVKYLTRSSICNKNFRIRCRGNLPCTFWKLITIFSKVSRLIRLSIHLKLSQMLLQSSSQLKKLGRTSRSLSSQCDMESLAQL